MVKTLVRDTGAIQLRDKQLRGVCRISLSWRRVLLPYHAHCPMQIVQCAGCAQLHIVASAASEMQGTAQLQIKCSDGCTAASRPSRLVLGYKDLPGCIHQVAIRQPILLLLAG